MGIKIKIKNLFIDTIERIIIKRKRLIEIKKFQNLKRIKIYSQIELTDVQKKSIDKLFLENYGYKVPYTWHRHFTAFTGNFDKYYFPELLYIPEFERFMNLDDGYCTALEDKNFLKMVAESMCVKMPATVFSCISGLIQDSDCNIVTLEDVLKLSGEFFVKPTVDSCSGKGCQIINVKSGIDLNTNTPLKDLLKFKDNNWVIQECIKCHDSITSIYPNSVNTFRIMTYIWKDKICHVPAIMRIGQGGANVDNAHAGGMFIAIDDDGTLHNTAFTEFKKEFRFHPDTKLRFDGYRINLFPEVLKAAKRCHSYITQIGCINWDFTIDRDGNIILIEANLKGGSIWLFEMAHGKGIFGDKTLEILRWMKLMKQTKKSERNKYAYGRMNDSE